MWCYLKSFFFFLGTIFAAYGVDAAFSYKYNQQRGICDKDGLAICPGFTTTHVIPVWFSILGIELIQALILINVLLLVYKNKVLTCKNVDIVH